ncbi:hypothetical protein PVK06_002457 [Gossypium arboreum]|uniref:Uncharacterized protein n=1 Tax=Gossypium arboreum TaxID=29729 RepID=A0ABR0R4U9_GOSAR|nr:hypothetical protein PVK06_002457 [Gossypium arboreum]
MVCEINIQLSQGNKCFEDENVILTKQVVAKEVRNMVKIKEELTSAKVDAKKFQK